MTLGYDFSRLIKSKFISQLRLYASVQNLFTFTNYSGMDPEVGYGGGDNWTSGIDWVTIPALAPTCSVLTSNSNSSYQKPFNRKKKSRYEKDIVFYDRYPLAHQL